jgi:hypothetical protein
MVREARCSSRLDSDTKPSTCCCLLAQRTEPNFTSNDLGKVTVPTTICDGQYDEIIRRDHTERLARARSSRASSRLPGCIQTDGKVPGKGVSFPITAIDCGVPVTASEAGVISGHGTVRENIFMNETGLQKKFDDISGLQKHLFFPRLKKDIACGTVFSAVRKNEIHFYHSGGRLCVYRGGRMFTNNRNLKRLDKGKSRDVAIPEDELSLELYDDIKDQCRERRTSCGKLGARSPRSTRELLGPSTS